MDRDLARRLEDQRNVARVVAADAIREIERILETGDTYATREIVANLKEALTPGSFLHNADGDGRRENGPPSPPTSPPFHPPSC